MPRRFRKRDDLHKVLLPGVGLVRDGRVLEGDEWSRYAPDSLVELLDSTPTGPKPKLLVDAPVVHKDPVDVAPPVLKAEAEPPKSEFLLTEENPSEEDSSEKKPLRSFSSSRRRHK